MKLDMKDALLKMAGIVLLIVICTLGAIACYLLYRNSLRVPVFCDWMFYSAIAYIALAAIPLYDVLTSSNSASYTYGEYAVKGKIDVDSRLNDMMSKKNYRFSIVMAASGVLLFVGALISDMLF